MRAKEFITETVAEQKEILELSRIVSTWLKNKIGDLEEFNSNEWEKGGKYYTDSLPPFIAKTSYLNRFYKGEYNINSILGPQSNIFKEPTIISWLESDPTITLQYLEDPLGGALKGNYDYTTNNISINSNATSHGIHKVGIWSSIRSTLSHEIQHALDYYKSHALISYKGDKTKTTNKEASNEVQDISVITDKIIEYLQTLSGNNYQLSTTKIPKKGILLSNIINADQLQSVKFKNYINDPSLIISVADYQNMGTRTASPSPFSDIDIRGGTNFKDIKKFIYQLLSSIRFSDTYTKIVGYDTSTERNEYLSKPLEINARLLQAFLAIDGELLNMKFKGFSRNPNKRRQQQSVVMNVIQKVFAQKSITPDLFPNKKRNKMWNRLLSRTYLFFQEKFSQTSNKKYKSFKKNIDIEDFSKLLSMALKGEVMRAKDLVTETEKVTFAGKDPSEFTSPNGGKAAMVIQTAQGSRYLITADGMVLRHKSFHANTGGEDQGLKDWMQHIEFYEPTKIGGTTFPLIVSKAVEKRLPVALSTTQDGKRVLLIAVDGKWRAAKISDIFKSVGTGGDASVIATYSTTPKLNWDPMDYNMNSNGTLLKVHPGSPVTHGIKV